MEKGISGTDGADTKRHDFPQRLADSAQTPYEQSICELSERLIPDEGDEQVRPAIGQIRE